MTPFLDSWQGPGARGMRVQGMLRGPDEVQNPVGQIFLETGLAGGSIEENGKVGILGNGLEEFSFMSKNVSKTWQN